MKRLLIGLGLLLAACQPLPPVDPGPSGPPTTLPTSAAACRTAGGTWGPDGMLGRDQCVLPYADAGKRCTDGDQCLGDCRLSEATTSSFPRPGAAAVGQCQATTSPFGCFTRVENGKADAALCVD
jgi:hypothetical protein